MSDKNIKFRAGIAEYNEDTKLCTPLAGQGIVKIQPNSEGADMGFWDFEWKPLDKTLNGKYEPISLILIPGETAWIPIKSANGGRVFGLIFSSNQKYFFWMQEKNKKGLAPDDLSPADQKITERIQTILNEVVLDEDADEMEVLEETDAAEEHEPDTGMMEPEGESKA
ncbi:similar to Saccharomyces cerevisiae YLR421C RPN13 Subunit of the 19S regulatory particle of the 26S proteasome lid [Maudiozyma barnettii]|uniref:Similar to Saccharomyces cerevisiae YLR421C RPN13 Subunit of the 19S regulatory particle of the 26S proteasome lid n=1 Tax=Maudiozyma barnettii TaxID=61262 RepID=A0A8H2VIJ0_9SACH|nr:proteasome regulatory particle lid subunit RPN13 [Kazachstania barnettii]CAB4256190.1 similar to Saccharomyces cerevisiae YLR421C RPN13 Subunit of the 19S regulatory particle of the 26S proteasome lid [Kazachstania barnettii]CAD1784798.1 similar to Saccharomyces cerevisiae YLR421C RPN13 Subunit of the 19S regulatory particle of the 26S proteasome lid [Kazachstania barnettii]